MCRAVSSRQVGRAELKGSRPPAGSRCSSRRSSDPIHPHSDVGEIATIVTPDDRQVAPIRRKGRLEGVRKAGGAPVAGVHQRDLLCPTPDLARGVIVLDREPGTIRRPGRGPRATSPSSRRPARGRDPGDGGSSPSGEKAHIVVPWRTAIQRPSGDHQAPETPPSGKRVRIPELAAVSERKPCVPVPGEGEDGAVRGPTQRQGERPDRAGARCHRRGRPGARRRTATARNWSWGDQLGAPGDAWRPEPSGCMIEQSVQDRSGPSQR